MKIWKPLALYRVPNLLGRMVSRGAFPKPSSSQTYYIELRVPSSGCLCTCCFWLFRSFYAIYTTIVAKSYVCRGFQPFHPLIAVKKSFFCLKPRWNKGFRLLKRAPAHKLAGRALLFRALLFRALLFRAYRMNSSVPGGKNRFLPG